MAEINWLEQVKKDAEELTKKRLKEDGVDTHAEREKEINAAEERAAKATEAEVVETKTKK
jgi:hypothetical protein